MDTPQLPRIVEPVPVDDDLCFELALIEDLEFGARFVVVAQQTIYETGDQVMAVKRKIVLPYSQIRPAVDMTIRFMARRAAKLAGGVFLRLVT
jgi:hypothetical protein